MKKRKERGKEGEGRKDAEKEKRKQEKKKETSTSQTNIYQQQLRQPQDPTQHDAPTCVPSVSHLVLIADLQQGFRVAQFLHHLLRLLHQIHTTHRPLQLLQAIKTSNPQGPPNSGHHQPGRVRETDRERDDVKG